jgi:hypothetical protein
MNRSPGVTLYMFIAALALIGGGIVVAFSCIVAAQARRRGYSHLVWLLACVASLNPLLVLVVLVMLPDARKKALRVKEMGILDAKLAALPPNKLSADAVAVEAGSEGDRSTAAPVSRSVGDLETQG